MESEQELFFYQTKMNDILPDNRNRIATAISHVFHPAVMGIPTLMLFKGGQIKERMTGYQPKEKLAAKVTPHV